MYATHDTKKTYKKQELLANVLYQHSCGPAGLTVLLHGSGTAQAATTRVTHAAPQTGTVHPNCNLSFVVSGSLQGNTGVVWRVHWNCGPGSFFNIDIDYGDGIGSTYECLFNCGSGDTTFSHNYPGHREYRGSVTGVLNNGITVTVPIVIDL